MISCCYQCAERKLYCHGNCERYIKEREAHLARKAVVDAERNISASIYTSRGIKVEKALKNRRRRY
jgi:hypothetical protein